MEKRIEVVELKVSDLKRDFGNPRKPLTSKKKRELQNSLETHGDFGIVVVDEHNNIISGNQRVDLLTEANPETIVLCKRLVGYSTSELRAINIKANTHAGEFDLDMLAEWTADLNLDLGFDIPSIDASDRKIKDMELIRYEKYDYVMIVCRNEVDHLNLVRALGIENKKIVISKGKNGERKIKARAIWYDDMKAQIVPQKDL